MSEDKPKIKGTCSYCGQTMLKNNLNPHFKICTGKKSEKPFFCQHVGCFSKFATSAHLRGHELRQHHNNAELPNVRCLYSDCQVIIQPDESLIKHIKDCHEKTKNSRTWECPRCKKVVREIYYHLRDTCSDRQIGCSFPRCKAIFRTDRGRKKHEAAFHGPSEKCEYENCRYVGKHLRAHITYVHKKDDLICEVCGKSVKKTSFRVHQVVCANRGSEQIYPCTYEGCQQNFSSEIQRKIHVWRRHKPSVKCPYENCNAVLKHGYFPEHLKLVHNTTASHASREVCSY